MGIGQVGPAHVAHPLLLTSSTLSHVDGHPGGPRCVPLHLWTRLQVTGLVLLNEEVADVREVWIYKTKLNLRVQMFISLLKWSQNWAPDGPQRHWHLTDIFWKCAVTIPTLTAELFKARREDQKHVCIHFCCHLRTYEMILPSQVLPFRSTQLKWNTYKWYSFLTELQQKRVAERKSTIFFSP